jgi:hypothetical protein
VTRLKSIESRQQGCFILVMRAQGREEDIVLAIVVSVGPKKILYMYNYTRKVNTL